MKHLKYRYAFINVLTHLPLTFHYNQEMRCSCLSILQSTIPIESCFVQNLHRLDCCGVKSVEHLHSVKPDSKSLTLHDLVAKDIHQGCKLQTAVTTHHLPNPQHPADPSLYELWSK
jgi:hypothetical protein